MCAPIPVPLEGVRAGWGTSLAFEAPGSLYLSWIEGVGGYRVGRWELGRGEIRVGKSFGLLRDALFDREHGRVHLLNEFGLHELEHDTLAGLRKLRKSMPQHPVRIASTGHAGLAVVGGFRAKTSLLVSLADYEIVARLSAAVPDVVLSNRDGFTFVGDGEGIVFGRDGKLVRRILLPECFAAHALDSGRVVVARTPDDGEDGTELQSFDPSKPAATKPIARVPDEVTRILGVDGHDHLVLETSTENGIGLIWVAKGEVRGRIDTGRERLSPVLAGSFVVGVPLLQPSEPFSFYTLSADAKPFAALAPVAKPKPLPAKPRRAAPGPAGVATFVDRRFDSAGPDHGHVTRAADGPLRFEGCVFDYLAIAAPLAIRDVTFLGCTFIQCSVLDRATGATFSDVVFDRFAIKGKPCFLAGLDLRRVTFRGKNRGTLILQQFPQSVLSRTGREDDWAVDISSGEFSGLELRGLPSRLVRRNPEIHGVIRRERLLDGKWRKLSLGVARIVLEDIEDGEQEDGLFLVNTLDRKWRERAEDLAKLRKAGIADV